MSVRMIQDRLNGYGCHSTLEEEQALLKQLLAKMDGIEPPQAETQRPRLRIAR